MKKWTMLLVFAVGLSASAQAIGQDLHEDLVFDDTEVDWEDAYDYAEVMETYEEGGEKWVTLFDEEQGVMWSMPAGASKEDFLEVAGLGEEEFGDGICIVNWGLPYLLKIRGASSKTYYYPNEFTYESGGSNWKLWSAFGDECWADIDGYVYSYSRNTSDYCREGEDEESYGQVWNQTTSSWVDAEYDDCFSGGSYYYYYAKEDTDVDDWDYCSYGGTMATRTWFYACDNWRRFYIEYEYTPV